jgi:hypothetical protein
MTQMKNAHITDDEIVAAYQRLASSNKAAKELGVTERRVVLVLRKRGIPRNGLEAYRKAAAAYPEGVQLEILRLHNEGVSQAELRKRFGGSDSSVRMAIIRNGGAVHPGVTSRRKVTDEQAARMVALYTSGKSQDDVADETGFSQAVVSRILRARGVKMRVGKPTGERHGQWGGGTYLTGDKYVRRWVAPDDFLAAMRDQAGYVLEHRLVMARILDRVLEQNETVHHINGDRTDNRPENLQLRQGRHGKHIVMCCHDCGSRNVGPVAIED